MWRRVASQSPIGPPEGQEQVELGQKYFNAWDALSKLLGSGRSLSGRERNCCFLNTGLTKFADVSAISGLDFPEDARGVAVVDWDSDGDLDLWISNRTGPRLRFLKNTYHDKNRFLAVRLSGTRCAKDAIGARVGVELADGGRRLVRALRAGEGYLAQSTKWLHFGLPAEAKVARLAVRWPDGQRELFQVPPLDQRYELVQGTGVPRRLTPRDDIELEPSTVARPHVPSTVRIALPARLPLPELSYDNWDGNSVRLVGESTGPVLINLWATWCTPCLEEIAAWKALAAEAEASGVTVVLLNVDKASMHASSMTVPQVRQVLERLQVPFSGGIAPPQLLDQLDLVQSVLTRRHRPLPIPSSFLVDAEGRLSVVYKGPTSADHVIRDIQNLDVSDARHRDLGVPFVGRWYTDPFPPDLMALPRRYHELDRPSEALAYLQRHVTAAAVQTPADAQSDAESLYETASAENLAEIYIGLALRLQQQDKRPEVIKALQSAVNLQPGHVKARLALVSIFQQDGRQADAARVYREYLELKPTDPVFANNLAWLLATTSDPKVRQPAEAVRLAEMVCSQSGRKVPATLDTLAAAYAAAGRFDDAVATAAQAVASLRKLGQHQAADAIEARRVQYQQHRAYISP